MNAYINEGISNRHSGRLSQWTKPNLSRSVTAAEIGQVMEDQKPMITAKGHLGRVPQSAGQGDAIFILLGCSMPVVLRACDAEYDVVESCYVHGCMEGEADDVLNW